MLELVRGGIYLNPMGTKLYLSMFHSDEVLQRFGEEFQGALIATSNLGDHL